MTAKKKPAPKRRTVAHADKELAELRERVVEATIRYAKENDSCQSATVDFLSEVLDEPSEALNREYEDRTTHTMRFTIEIDTTYDPSCPVDEIDLYGTLDSMSLAEQILETVGFSLAWSSGEITGVLITDATIS